MRAFSVVRRTPYAVTALRPMRAYAAKGANDPFKNAPQDEAVLREAIQKAQVGCTSVATGLGHS